MTRQSDTILPRNRSLAVQQPGVFATMAAWLRAWVRPSRPVETPARRERPGFAPRRAEGSPSLREQTELIQLRAENRRLRSQLDALAQRSGQDQREDA